MNTESVILNKKVVGKVIYESAKLEDIKLLHTKSYSKQMFLITVRTYKYLFQLNFYIIKQNCVSNAISTG